MVFQFKCEESKYDSKRANYSRFVLEPLERGQGATMGNALRRILLSELEGAAVTAIRIAGVNHEFATVPGVKEDVLEIILNMKEIVLKSYSASSQIGRLTVNGPATIRAAQFDLPSDVDIVDPSQYVATLAENSKLEMEFKIEKGKGYRAIEKGQGDASAIDFLQIDSVFMPVTKVNYTVDSTRVDGSLEKDKLILEIWTNGSISGQEALSQAANILVELFTPLKEISIDAIPSNQPDDQDLNRQIPIEELQLSVRAYNCLKRAQINTVADLVEFTQEDLMEIKNFGQKSAIEVIEALQKRLGITLPLEKAKP